MKEPKSITSVEGLVTLMFTGTLCAMLLFNLTVDNVVLTIFSTGFGSIMTFFFTKPKIKTKKEDENDDNRDT